MKIFLKIFGLAAAIALALLGGQLRAQDDSSPSDSSVCFQSFYDQLASQGTWIQTDKYGYVFQPTESDPNWRPYTYGHWVDTDAGMTWVSDEPFGWATYHYGRWVNLDGYGWVWVPGYTWAPAWVGWREGDDDVGWAPLPPDSDEGIDFYADDFDWGFGFHIGDDCDLAYGIGPWWYNFCPVVYIGDPYCWRHFRDRRDNFARIGRTRNVTNINFHRDGAGRFGRVTAEGPSVAALNARAQTPIEHAQLTSASRLANAGLHGNTLAVFAPRVDPATVKTARPGAVSQTLANTSVNRGTDITHPLAVNSRISPAGATAEQIHAATLAQANVPAQARVATPNTRISRPLTQPLTSLRTDARSTPTIGADVRRNAVAGTSRVAAPSLSELDARFTGVPETRHTAIPSNVESRYTGEAIAPSHTTSTFRSFPSYSSGEIYRPSNVYQTMAPVFHSETGTSMFRSSASAYHPSYNFHSFAPTSQSHVGGYAPAAHFSGGGARASASGTGGQSGYSGRR